MRRSHAGHHNSPFPSGVATEYLEEENERMTDELKEKIGVLKSITLDMRTEFKYQDKLLRDMLMVFKKCKEVLFMLNTLIFQDDDFDKSQGFLGRTMSHVLRLSRGKHNYYILYLILFSFVVFIILWITLKFK
ncbi:hypothetical protein J437_LFUL007953 [Ladona fulva]|uniref:BET1-like protein n=1 Tax=Ladona fulva TaxID=123851 RepID=A0A8K0KEM0_LADFU|nr:hypothetical protein J437_LFUL007953 [Ladona fulva]